MTENENSSLEWRILIRSTPRSSRSYHVSPITRNSSIVLKRGRQQPKRMEVLVEIQLVLVNGQEKPLRLRSNMIASFQKSLKSPARPVILIRGKPTKVKSRITFPRRNKSPSRITLYLVHQKLKNSSLRHQSIRKRMRLIGLHRDREVKSTPTINPQMKMSSRVERKLTRKFLESRKKSNSFNKRRESLTFSLPHLPSRINLLPISI